MRTIEAHDVARRMPWHVELPERPGGWGYRLNEISVWCGRRFERGAWYVFGGWFFFLEESDAVAFAAEVGAVVQYEGLQAARRRWPGRRR